SLAVVDHADDARGQVGGGAQDVQLGRYAVARETLGGFLVDNDPRGERRRAREVQPLPGDRPERAELADVAGDRVETQVDRLPLGRRRVRLLLEDLRAAVAF